MLTIAMSAQMTIATHDQGRSTWLHSLSHARANVELHASATPASAASATTAMPMIDTAYDLTNACVCDVSAVRTAAPMHAKATTPDTTMSALHPDWL